MVEALQGWNSFNLGFYPTNYHYRLLPSVVIRVEEINVIVSHIVVASPSENANLLPYLE
jgi:hypothetical protein